MKKMYILILTLLSCSCFSQNIKLDELMSLRKENLATVEEKLANKGWRFSGGVESENDKLSQAFFAYQSLSNENSTSSLIFFSYNDDWKRIGIQLSNRDVYNAYLDRIKSFNCKLIKSDVLDGNIVKVYKGLTLIFKITISSDSNDTTTFSIHILEYADFKNNFDVEFDSDGYPNVYQSEKSLNAIALRKSGENKMKLKNYKGAIVDFDKSLGLDEFDGGWCYAYRGLAQLRLNNIQDAEKDFERAKENTIIGLVAYGDGITAYEENRYEDALLLFDLSIVLDPNDGRSFYDRGLTNLSLGQKDQACLDFKKSAALGNDDAQKSLMEKCN